MLDRASPYNTATKTCNLCTTEKFYIILKPHLATIKKKINWDQPADTRHLPYYGNKAEKVHPVLPIKHEVVVWFVYPVVV